MKKMFILAALGMSLCGAAMAEGHQFNQPMGRHQNYGWHNGGGNNWHGGGNRHAVIPDPVNPASVRDWSKPQAQSVSCIGAGCTLHYPTPRQQAISHGQLICDNRGCHY